MSRRVKGRKRMMSEINVVPYIDVMLVLLVIFMITTPLLTQGVKVELPRVTSDPVESTPSEPLVVQLNAAGEVALILDGKEETMDRERLVNRVGAIMRYKPETPVLVGGDRSVPYGQVMLLISALQAAGVPSVGLLTEAPEP